MTKLPIGTRTRLPANSLFSLDNRSGQRIEVREGAVWITRTSEPRDIVLEAGDSYVINDPRGVIVGAIHGGATVSAYVAWGDALAA